MSQPAPSRGIPALVRRLRRGNQGQQQAVALELLGMFSSALQAERSEEVAAAMAAAGAVPIAVQIISHSRHSDLVQNAAAILAALALDSAPRAEAIRAAGAVAPLVQLLHSDSEALRQSAMGTLTAMASHAVGDEYAARAASAADEVVPAAIQPLDSSDARIVDKASRMLRILTADSPSRQQAIHAAGGIPALVRSVQAGGLRHSDTAEVQEQALRCLRSLAERSTERCTAIIAVDGARECVGALTKPRQPDCRAYAGDVLFRLAMFASR